MILNTYEESHISKLKLPLTWQSEGVLFALEEFLQQNWEHRAVFYDDRIINSKQQFLGFVSHSGIRTKNYIGTISFNGSQLNIYPKMFKESKDDYETHRLSQKHLMQNLVNWLNYCNRTNYPFINIPTDFDDSGDLKELFINLYIRYVHSILERGLLHQYIEETEDISAIKGKFDVNDYYCAKIPLGRANKFKCSYSTFEYDNTVNRIIKFTCKHLYLMTTAKNQRILRHILTKLNDVSDISCIPSDCDNIRLSKMHSHYRVILNMSKIFLLNKSVNYSLDTNEAFCFLFPTELLFEGFVGGYIQEVVRQHGGKAKLQQSDMSLIDDIEYAGQSLGAAFTMRHDILVEIKGKSFILDTKYKQISRFEGDAYEIKRVVAEEPKQVDIYQVCEYARKRDILDVYLLYPMYRFEDDEPYFPVGKSLGASGQINIHFIRLPFIFEEDDEQLKLRLNGIIKYIFSL